MTDGEPPLVKDQPGAAADRSLVDDVRQLVTDAVFNAEHAAGGIPAHHRELQQGSA